MITPSCADKVDPMWSVEWQTRHSSASKCGWTHSGYVVRDPATTEIIAVEDSTPGVFKHRRFPTFVQGQGNVWAEQTNSTPGVALDAFGKVVSSQCLASDVVVTGPFGEGDIGAGPTWELSDLYTDAELLEWAETGLTSAPWLPEGSYNGPSGIGNIYTYYGTVIIGLDRTDYRYRIIYQLGSTCYLKVWLQIKIESWVSWTSARTILSDVVVEKEVVGTGSPCVEFETPPPYTGVVDYDPFTFEPIYGQIQEPRYVKAAYTAWESPVVPLPNIATASSGLGAHSGVSLSYSIVKYSCVPGYVPDISDPDNPQPNGYPDPAWEPAAP